jgi:hypothetical protein
MPTVSGGMMRCPTCQGSTWDPKTGKDCRVCGATGALTARGEHVPYDDASDFIRRMDEVQPRRFLR